MGAFGGGGGCKKGFKAVTREGVPEGLFEDELNWVLCST